MTVPLPLPGPVASAPRLPGSALVADPPEQGPSFLPFLVCLHSLWGEAVNHPEDAPPLEGRSHDDLKRVGCGTVDAADLRAVLDLVEDIDGIGVAQQDAEDVTGALFQIYISVSVRMCFTLPRRFCRGNALHVGYTGLQILVRGVSCQSRVFSPVPRAGLTGPGSRNR